MKNKKLVIKGTIIDGIYKEPLKQGVIIVEGNTITDVGKEGEIKIPEDAEVIQEKTVMPGMIDCHVHLYVDGGADAFKTAAESTMSTLAIKATIHLKRSIEAGFTTLRSVGEPEYLGISLRDAVSKGLVLGPRILTSGQSLSITGGHGTKLLPWLHSDTIHGNFVDGVEEVRKSVRTLIGSGVDLIKILATGGVMDISTGPGAQNYNLDEIKVAVEEAHKFGKKVAAHVEGLNGAKDCIRAGVDTLEHGSELDDEAIQMMKDKGIFLVPTLIVGYNIQKYGIAGGMPEYAIEKEAQINEKSFKSFKRAYKAGVKIVMGTDAGAPFTYHGDNAKELEIMVNNGMKPIDAIMSVTRIASEAIGLSDKIGTLEKNKLADLLLVDGDPLKDITILQNKNLIRMVMKDGEKVVVRS